MKNTHLIAPVHVVSDQISQTLQQTAELLDHYVEFPENKETLVRSVELIDQVLGSVKILGLKGATDLLNEMKSLVEAIIAEKVPELQTAFELLVASTLFIPRYIEHFGMQQHEMPVLILNTLNALRKTSRKSMLPEHRYVGFSEREISFPVIVDTPPSTTPTITLAQLRRLRHMYQVGLLGVIREKTVSTHLKYIDLTLKRFAAHFDYPPFLELISATEALIDAIHDGGVSLSASVKFILGKLDRTFHTVSQALVTHQYESCEHPLRNALIAVCYYLARSVSNADSVREFKERYQLDDRVANERMIQTQSALLEAPDRAVMRRVTEEILTQLDGVKDQIDQLNRIGKLPANMSQDTLDSLGNLSTTLHMLDLKNASELMDSVIHALTAIVNGTRLIEPELTSELADNLVMVENALYELNHNTSHQDSESPFYAHLDSARKASIKETRTELEWIKESLEAYIDNFMDSSFIEETPQRIALVSGALKIMGLDRASNILNCCHQFTDRIGHQTNTPPSEMEVEILADTLASIEWYLECLEQYSQTDEGLLDVADEGITLLGFSAKVDPPPS